MLNYNITDGEFNLFRDFIYQQAGISLSDEKKTLVTSRLSKRLRHYSLKSFQNYFDLLTRPDSLSEKQMAVDLLTTNETYFFREPKHFAFLEKEILKKWDGKRKLKLWSAASSTGEEAYSLAMLFDDMLKNKPWGIFGSDISTRVLKKAQQGHYIQNRIDGIPKEYLHKYCLRGTGEQEGTLLIDSKLRSRVTFAQINLKQPLLNVDSFDIIFLRNVLIYFDRETKTKIINQLIDKLRPDGYLFIGHSESLKDITSKLKTVIPTVYQKI